MSNVIKLVAKDNIKTSDGREFTRLVGGFGEDKPVITDKQIAELLGYHKKERQVRVQINNNIDHFEDSDLIDFRRVHDLDTLPEVLIPLGYAKQSITQAKNIYILSQAGFLLYLKFAEGDKAVEIYKDFIEDYFQTKAENKVMKKTIQEEIEFLNEQKALLLGKSFLSTSQDEKFDMYNQTEEINRRIVSMEKSLTKENVIEQLQPKLHIANVISESKSCFDMGVFSKVLNINGLGRNNMFAWLRGKEILRDSNEPYQRYMKYFKVIPVVSRTGYTSNKTLIKPNGVEYLVKKLIDDGRAITKPIGEILKELEDTSVA